MPQHTRPIGFAALVTPWAVRLVFVLWSAIGTLWTRGAGGLKVLPFSFALLFYGLPFTYAAEFTFGLPMCCAFSRTDRLRPGLFF